jgi:arylsulfatase A-like enzyme
MAVEVQGGNREELCSVRLSEASPRGTAAGRLDIHPPSVEATPSLSDVIVQLAGAAVRRRIEVGRQNRSSLALRPDVGVVWNLTVPAGAHLAFAYAVREEAWSGAGDGSEFRLEAGTASEEPRTLWRDYLTPRHDPRHRRWHHAKVDLSAFAEREVEIRLVSAASPPVREPFRPRHDARNDLPVFASPRVVAPGGGTNVILITMDTLRGDHVGFAGYPREVSPRMDALAQESTVFLQAYATGPWTHPSTGTLLTGLLPNEHLLGSTDEGPRPFAPDVTFLAQTLRAAGYATAAVSNNRIVTPDEGFARGFDSFDTRCLEDDEYYGAERVTAHALEWLSEANDRPFFLYLHYFDPHDPYQAPPPFTREFVPDSLLASVEAKDVLRGQVRRSLLLTHRQRPPQHEVELLHRFYEGEIRYLDHWIGVLVDELAGRGLLENTTILWVGDHGEEFLERGTLQHQQHLYNELVRIPMMVRFADGTARGERVEATVSLTDVVPTVLAQCGISFSAERWPHGRDLGAMLSTGAWVDAPAYAISYGRRGKDWKATEYGPKRAVVDGAWKYIWNQDGAEELYRILEDPGESRDLASEHPEVVERLRWLADSVLQDEEDSAPPVLQSELREKLKALGYVD